MIKAWIEKSEDNDGLWLLTVHTVHDDGEDETFEFAITEDEVEPIKEACEKWLKGKENNE